MLKEVLRPLGAHFDYTSTTFHSAQCLLGDRTDRSNRPKISPKAKFWDGTKQKPGPRASIEQAMRAEMRAEMR